VENPAPTPAAPPVVPTRPCIGCGYNLHGLPDAGLCPECSTPIVFSLRRDLLRFAPSAHLRTLRRGAAILTAWLALAVLVAITAALVVTDDFGMLFDLPEYQLAGAAAIALMALGWSAGWQLLAAPQRPFPPGLAPRGERTAARVLSIIVLFAATLWILLAAAVIFLPRSLVYQIAEFFFAAVSLGGGFALIAQFFAAFAYLRRLAHRVPDTRLRASASRMLVLVPACAVLGVLVAAAGTFLEGQPAYLAFQAGTVLFAACGVVCLIESILRLRRVLREQAQLASEQPRPSPGPPPVHS